MLPRCRRGASAVLLGEQSHMFSHIFGFSEASGQAKAICFQRIWAFQGFLVEQTPCVFFKKCLVSWRLLRKRKTIVFIGIGSFVGVWVRKKHVFIDLWPLVGVWLSQTACFCKVLASRSFLGAQTIVHSSTFGLSEPSG